jgi:hypothetical protein
LTQTFLHSKLFPCIHTADHTFSKFEFPAHASGADDTFDTLSLQSIQWRHIVVPGGGITLKWVAELIVSSTLKVVPSGKAVWQ